MASFGAKYAFSINSHADCVRVCFEKGGILGYKTEQYADIGPLPEGWSYKCFGTGGVGNAGTYYLVGLTPANREIVRQGKIAQLMRDHEGLTHAMATVCIAHKLGMECMVVKTAIEHKDNPKWGEDWTKGSWDDFLFLGGMPPLGISCPRGLVVQKIIRGWWRTGAVDQPTRAKGVFRQPPTKPATYNPFAGLKEALSV